MPRRDSECDDSLRCSFCHKSQETAGKLISSPRDYPRAYICDECVAVCVSIIDDDKQPQPDISEEETGAEAVPHPFLAHPLASDLLYSVEKWIRLDSLGLPAAEEFSEMRTLAEQMFSGPE